MIDTELVTFVMSRSAVVSWIESRFYPAPLPQSKDGQITAALPAATYADISTVDDYASGKQSGFHVTRYQIDTIAPKKLTAVLIARAFNDVLAGFQGAWDSGIQIRMIKRSNYFTSYIPEAQLYRGVSDFIIKYVKG